MNVSVEKITFPRASEHVPAQIAMIETLVETFATPLFNYFGWQTMSQDTVLGPAAGFRGRTFGHYFVALMALVSLLLNLLGRGRWAGLAVGGALALPLATYGQVPLRTDSVAAAQVPVVRTSSPPELSPVIIT